MDSGGNRNSENWREARNRPGLGQRVQPAHRFRFGAGSQGINFRILLPLTTLVHFPLKSFQSALVCSKSRSIPVRDSLLGVSHFLSSCKPVREMVPK